MKNPQLSLKQAVEQQLQLILKMEEDRKVLKRENKNLNQKYQKLAETLKKYNVIKLNQETSTQETQMLNKKQLVQYCEKGCQIQLLQENNMNYLNSNNSRLLQAQSFLKGVDSSIHFNSNTTNLQSSKLQDKSMTMMFQNQTLSQNILQNQEYRVKGNQSNIKVGTSTSNSSNNNLSSEIVKMAKQIANLKRELKQSDHQNKLRQKDLKQTKKCLQTKGQALQKCRKQFNQLSLLYNGDKLKSVRSLQVECQKLRIRGIRCQQHQKSNSQLKKLLSQLTSQYEVYRQQKQKKISSLLKELKERTISTNQ